jgi:hypothetical protein
MSLWGRYMSFRQIASCWAILLPVLFPAASNALPSFAQQTGQPCSQCHVGAYGPQLKQYGRDFKLYGYVSGDGQNWLPPISLVTVSSFTHTEADRAKPLPHFDTNDNTILIDRAKVAYAGALPGKVGMFSELSYDGVRHVLAIDNIDIRRAFNPTIAGHDVILGLDLNNRPTIQDLWNSTPTFEFLPTTTPLSPTPNITAVVDGALAQRVAGYGGYGMWDNFLYAELLGYQALNQDFVHRSGIQTTATTDIYDGVMPYWRVAVQRDFSDRHYLALGVFGISADRFPKGIRPDGTDHIADTAGDLTYQFTGSKQHYWSAHATYIHENDRLDASHHLFGSNASDYLNTMRLDVSYSYHDQLTPTVEVFQSRGSHDPQFFKTAAGTPDSTGYVVEVAYAVWGIASSPVGWSNIRLAVRWIGYSKFNGASSDASGNNTVYVNVRFAVAPFGAAIKR